MPDSNVFTLFVARELSKKLCTKRSIQKGKFFENYSKMSPVPWWQWREEKEEEEEKGEEKKRERWGHGKKVKAQKSTSQGFWIFPVYFAF